MVTLSSCLIWQIISFILPPNEYDCVHAWTMLGNGPAIDLQKMPILAKKIIFSDGAHSDIGGYVNKQNCCIWAIGNPYINDALKTSHCLVRILVHRHNWAIFLRKWARIGRYSQWRSLSGHVERSFVHKNWRGRYGNIWFQQDDTTCHTAEATLNVLRPVFENRIISRKADVVWPRRSSDLTPLDYY